MPAGSPHPEPQDPVHGVFRVLPRTDGKWIVYDPRRPVAKRTVKVFKSQKQASEAATLWHALGHG